MDQKKDARFFAKLQQNELDGSLLYRKIAQITKNEADRKTLTAIAEDELQHAEVFQKYSGVTLKPQRFRTFWRLLAARVFGYTFVIKLLEISEGSNIAIYREDIDHIPELKEILEEEERHEEQLLNMLGEERLKYVGDMVLGMNDALVELTGALAGYTLAMRNTHIIAMAGLITGVSATLSMAASGYLAPREDGQKNAAKSATFTGFAYLFTVALLILPYLILPAGSYLWALGITLMVAIAIIAMYNYYISVAKGRRFLKNFTVMAGISLGVAVISFTVGILVKNVLGIEL